MSLSKDDALILIYDFHPYGHCPGWMGLVALAFIEAGCEVVVACCVDFDSMAPTVEMIRQSGGSVVPIPDSVTVHPEYAAQLASNKGIKHIFFPNFDSVVYDLGKKGGSVNFSGLSVAGIWLRPTLAGECLSGFRRAVNKLSRTQKSKAIRRQSRKIGNNRKGISLFAEGSGAASDLFIFLLNGEFSGCLSTYLPVHQQSHICDPWLEKSAASRDEARARLGLAWDRKIFLHAGTSRSEKGLSDACLAFSKLPSTIKKSVCLLRAGVVGRGDAPLLNKLERNGLAFVIDRYMSDEELLLCYAACDSVLIPYRDQKESSGVLVHAAAHGRPVIACDYGVIGKWTKEYRLGLTFCHKDIGGLAQSIEELFFLDNWCSDGMEEFSRLNSPQAFKDALVRAWALPKVLCGI